MQCPECGERMTGSYDGGAENNYSLNLPSCRYCGYIDWDADEEEDEKEGEEEEDIPTNDAEDRYNRGLW